MPLRRVEPVVRRALASACRVPSGSRLLVAVSGGADSTALLVALARIAPERHLTIEAAHLNHRLRGAASEEDAAFVARLCARLGVPLHAAAWDTRARMRRRGLAGENGLRVLRREFLEAVAAKRDGALIATAHTADDQLETLILRLLRGAGLRGLGAMRPRSGRWIKPLLDATRHDIEADLRREGHAWREDASNLDLAFTRNRVRHDVVPALIRAAAGRDATAGARATLARRAAAIAEELRDADRALAVWTRAMTRGATAGGAARVEIARTARLPAASRRALVTTLWRRVAPAGVGLQRAHLSQMERLWKGARGPVALPAGYLARRDGGAVLIEGPRIQSLTLPRAGRAGRASKPIRSARLRGPAGRTPGPSKASALKATKGISENAGSGEYSSAPGAGGALAGRRSDPSKPPGARAQSMPRKLEDRAIPVRTHRRTS